MTEKQWQRKYEKLQAANERLKAENTRLLEVHMKALVTISRFSRESSELFDELAIAACGKAAWEWAKNHKGKP